VTAGPAITGVLLTGTIGAGKTTTAEAVSDRLHEEAIRHALLDLDWLGQVYPPPVEDAPYNESLAITNLEVIWPNFVHTGIRHVILAATVITRPQLDRLEAAMPGCSLTVVRVVARPDTVADRLRGRDSGRLLEDFLRRTDAMAEEIERAALESFHVRTDDRSPEEVAKEILRQLAWLVA
jgi:dephospho-CoA kinase